MICELLKDDEGQARIRWRCPFCKHRWDFHASVADDIGFFVVHHLVSKHRLSLAELLTYDPNLVDSMNEYFGSKRGTEVVIAVRGSAENHMTSSANH